VRPQEGVGVQLIAQQGGHSGLALRRCWRVCVRVCACVCRAGVGAWPIKDTCMCPCLVI
jgi:hypothetical protein